MEKLNFQTTPISKEDIIEELTGDKTLNKFFMENDLTSKVIEDYLPTLLSFQRENNHCVNCEGLHACKQDMEGHQPMLRFVNGNIRTYYRQCNFLVSKNDLQNRASRIDALYMPKMIEQADITDYRLDTEGRKDVYRYINNVLLRNLSLGEKVKGMYLHGEYKTGKTYTLGAVANELITKGHHVLIAYYPDLVREFKSSIGNNSLESMISKLKSAEILMLDDIGGENFSAWVRDEVLGPILQHRLLDDLPTFFSSNVSIKDLSKYFQNNDSKLEKMKAFRILTRIRELTLDHEFKM